MLLAVAGGLSYLAGRAYREGYLMLNNPPLMRYPVQGIDVSHHQGAIDWVAVTRDPRVRFAFIKATEGGDFGDGDFIRNWQGAQAAGLIRGAYHFFTFCRPGIDQAQNYLTTVPAASDILPGTIDLEFGGNLPKDSYPGGDRSRSRRFRERSTDARPATTDLLRDACVCRRVYGEWPRELSLPCDMAARCVLRT
jgi:hypothetical protein